jgi:hypothetical protein
MRCAAGQRDNCPGRRGPAAHAAVRILGVEGELALQDEVDLAWVVPVHDRRAAAGRHADLDGEQRA